MIEHRLARRIKGQHEALLVVCSNSLILGKLRNVSGGGLFVESHGVMTRNAYVQIRFSLPGDVTGARYRLAAIVVHRAADGIGLMVDRSKTDSATALDALLDHCACKPAGAQPAPGRVGSATDRLV